MKFENCKEYCSLKNNKENIRKLMKEFDCEASGKSNLIRPLVTDENGRFDEKKAEKLITELVEDMDRYGYRYKMWLGHITAENALPEQKSFCRYVRMYLYLAIKMSLLDFSQYGFLMDNIPNGSFDNLLSGCIDFESNNLGDTYPMTKGDVATVVSDPVNSDNKVLRAVLSVILHGRVASILSAG